MLVGVLTATITLVQLAQVPSIYWSASPTLANETLLLAGAGLAGVSTAVRFCNDSICSLPMSAAADVWEHSVQVVVPACGPPCHVELTSKAGLVKVPLNEPDVWWATTARPSALNFSRSAYDPLLIGRQASVRVGERLRVFGRSLSWDTSTQHCTSGAPRPTPGTTLTLHQQLWMAGEAEAVTSAGEAPTAEVPSSAAGCYEAAFLLPTSLPMGDYLAVVHTSWGSSAPLELHVAPALLPDRPIEIDVLVHYRGNLSAALAAADAVTSHGAAAEVVLGEHTYMLDVELKVPVNTTIRGSGPEKTELTFRLPRGSWRAMTVQSGVSLRDFTLTLANTNIAGVAALRASGTQGLLASGLVVTLEAPSGIAVDLERVLGFEVVNSTLGQQGTCEPGVGVLPVLRIHASRFGRLAHNTVKWRCMAFGVDVTDDVVMEENSFERLGDGDVPGGNYISVYDLHYPSSRYWSIARNTFTRSAASASDAHNWQFHESLTFDAPHSYNMGQVLEVLDGGRAVRLDARMHPPRGATLLVLGGPGAGQARLVTGRTPDGRGYALDAPFDPWLTANSSMLGALPTIGEKLVVGNTFISTAVVEWFGMTTKAVVADNTIVNASAVPGTGGVEVPGALVANGLCYKGAPGQVFFSEYLGNQMVNSDGISLIDDFGNAVMDDCKARGWCANRPPSSSSLLPMPAVKLAIANP